MGQALSTGGDWLSYGAGSALGALALATSLKHGTTGQMLAQRSTMINDPEFRNQMGPFSSGFLFTGGGEAPTYDTSLATGPTIPSGMSFKPNLPPLSDEKEIDKALKQSLLQERTVNNRLNTAYADYIQQGLPTPSAVEPIPVGNVRPPPGIRVIGETAPNLPSAGALPPGATPSNIPSPPPTGTAPPTVPGTLPPSVPPPTPAGSTAGVSPTAGGVEGSTPASEHRKPITFRGNVIPGTGAYPVKFVKDGQVSPITGQKFSAGSGYSEIIGGERWTAEPAPDTGQIKAQIRRGRAAAASLNGFFDRPVTDPNTGQVVGKAIDVLPEGNWKGMAQLPFQGLAKFKNEFMTTPQAILWQTFDAAKPMVLDLARAAGGAARMNEVELRQLGAAFIPTVYMSQSQARNVIALAQTYLGNIVNGLSDTGELPKGMNPDDVKAQLLAITQQYNPKGVQVDLDTGEVVEPKASGGQGGASAQAPQAESPAPAGAPAAAPATPLKNPHDALKSIEKWAGSMSE